MPPTTDRTPQEPSLGKYLADLRGARGMTLRAVEEATNREISNAYLSQIETGKIAKPSPNILYTLANLYKANYQELMERAGYVVPKPSHRPAQRQARIAALAKEDLTPEEEDLLLQYMAFLKQRRRK
jgi:transcriptional regulator with XRE-family HTH domain